MANRRLTPDQLELARTLLGEVRERLRALSGGDPELLFAFRRKIAKELTYDERSKPTVLGQLKRLKMKEQGGISPLCNEALPERGAVLDRARAIDGFTAGEHPIDPSALRHRPACGEWLCLAGSKVARAAARVALPEIVIAYLDFCGAAHRWLGRVNLASRRGTGEQGTVAQGHR